MKLMRRSNIALFAFVLGIVPARTCVALDSEVRMNIVLPGPGGFALVTERASFLDGKITKTSWFTQGLTYAGHDIVRIPLNQEGAYYTDDFGEIFQLDAKSLPIISQSGEVTTTVQPLIAIRDIFGYIWTRCTPDKGQLTCDKYEPIVLKTELERLLRIVDSQTPLPTVDSKPLLNVAALQDRVAQTAKALEDY